MERDSTVCGFAAAGKSNVIYTGQVTVWHERGMHARTVRDARTLQLLAGRGWSIAWFRAPPADWRPTLNKVEDTTGGLVSISASS